MATKKIKINFKMPTPTAAERLHALQQKNRKAAGLPDPSEYKKKLDSMKTEEVNIGDKVSFDHPMTAVPGKTMKKVGTVHKIEGDTAHVKVKDKYGVMTHKKNASELKKENYEEDDGPLSQEQLDEISSQLKASYVSGAKKQIKQSLPFTKKTDEYRDIAKNFIAKRQKGIAKANEEVEQLDEYESKSGVYKHKGKYGTSHDDPGVKSSPFWQAADKDEDDEKPKKAAAPAEKRGRGRPAGAKSGARQQGSGSGSDYSGIAHHSLNLPNSNR
jgi:hypothetical protein